MNEEMLKHISDYEIKESAHNIRKNGELISRYETDNIKINTKKDKAGIDIIIKKNTIDEFVHIPVIIDKTDYTETVYNDFYIESGCNVTIVAGCGIHNECETPSVHNGIHAFHIEPNAKVKYVEKHYADGFKENNKYINTTTIIDIKDNSSFTMETAQISGIDEAVRITESSLQNNSSLVIKETLMSDKKEKIETNFKILLNGKNSNAEVSSKSVAKGTSTQKFISSVEGNNKCFAHISCDAIVMDKSHVSSSPEVIANNPEAELSHEAVIGKIAGLQIQKLMTLGLDEKEAENKILEGFLKA